MEDDLNLKSNISIIEPYKTIISGIYFRRLCAVYFFAFIWSNFLDTQWCLHACLLRESVKKFTFAIKSHMWIRINFILNTCFCEYFCCDIYLQHSFHKDLISLYISEPTAHILFLSSLPLIIYKVAVVVLQQKS